MIKNQLSNYSSVQEAFKPLVYDSRKQNEMFESRWPNKCNDQNRNEKLSNEETKTISSNIMIEDMENIGSSGLEINFDKEISISKESMNIERSYHEIPKFLISYSDLYQNKLQYDSLEDYGKKFSDGLLTTETSSCWTNNTMEQNFVNTNSNKSYNARDENNLLEEDDGILDVLSHALNKTCLNDEHLSEIDTVEGAYKYNFTNNLSSTSSNSTSIPYVLGVRVLKKGIDSNKRQISNLQLNTYDIMNLCSQFGNIIDISIDNDGHYVTYETRASLEKALNSLQNLQISSEGDFIHVYIHQTSNTMIGGIERSINLVKNQWNHELSPINFPNIKDMCSTVNIVDSIHLLSNSCTNTTTSSSSTATTSTSNNTTTSCSSGNSPWNSIDNPITNYEKSLWSAWLNDNRNQQNNSTSKSNIKENNDNNTNNENKNIKISNINKENSHEIQNGLNMDFKINNDSKNNVTYSSIVGSNLHQMKNNIDVVINPIIQDINNVKLTKTTNKIENKSKSIEIDNNMSSLLTSTPSPTSTISSSSSSSATSQNQNSTLLKKYTARYEIQIPPDNQFQIARRIIGTRGVNMKRIFKLTQSKLRLRGKGSGYLEGYNKQEADEPLHLCISSTNSEQYINARKLVERLLLKIYQEYDEFLLSADENHKPLNLQLKFKETMRTKQIENINNNNNNHSSGADKWI